MTARRSEDGTSEARLPLDGVRVVDLTSNIAGPFATMILGDLGADVTKIERPPGGDDARRMSPTESDSSAYFLAINRNKRSMLLDLRVAADRDKLSQTLDESHVFVTNLRPSKLDALGLSAEQVALQAPHLIYADITGYGSVGLESDRAGYDLILQARSGLVSVNGDPKGPPVRVGVSILDMSSGMWLAMGILAALCDSDGKRPKRVSTSLLEAGTSFLTYDIASYALTGDVPGRRGSEHPAFGPYGVYRCKGGTQLALGAGADHLFERLAAAIGEPGWIDDDRFRDNNGRTRNRELLRLALERRLSTDTASHWASVLSAAGIAADEVASVPTVLADPQLNALDFWVDVPRPGSTDVDDSIRIPGLPLRFDQRRPPVRLDPPSLDPNSRPLSTEPHPASG